MKIYKGKSICSGNFFGRLRVFKRDKGKINEYKIDDIYAEIERFKKAREKSILELSKIYKKASSKLGEEAEIFKAHSLMIQDESFIDLTIEHIEEEEINVEAALLKAGNELAEIFRSMDSEYMRERAEDILEVTNRLIENLEDKDKSYLETYNEIDEPYILLSDDFTASEIINLNKEKILALVTTRGSENSHAAILLRTLGIASLISVPIEDYEGLDGKLAAVDIEDSKLYINPDDKTRNMIMDKMKLSKNKDLESIKYNDIKVETSDGIKIKLFANISGPADMEDVIKYAADGIGLFRTEFLYLARKNPPSEDEQFRIYRDIANKMGDKPVIIRTLDLGADKKIDYIDFPKEENPAMGLRGIRLCFKNIEIFKTQLRAIFRAAIYGNIKIMFPMINSVLEIERIEEIINEVKIDLELKAYKYKIPKKGIMIETPAAAVISDILSKKVDFLSIGTNDLTQYTMAIDRENDSVSEFLDKKHEAILRLIKLTAKNAKKAGIELGICGELGSDISLSKFFMDVGIGEISMTASKIPQIRRRIIEI